MTVARRLVAAPTLAAVTAMLVVGTPATHPQGGEGGARAAHLARADDARAACDLPDLEGVESAVARQLEAAAAGARSAVTEGSSPARRATAWGELGRHLHAYGLLPSAERCYRAAAQFAPLDPAWPHLLGALLAEQGRAPEARRQYRRALSLAPAAVHTRARLAELERTEGHLDTAEQLFRQVLDRRPADAAALASMGQLALSRRDYATAVEYLSAALEAVPAANALHYPLALAYRGLGRLEPARHHLTLRGAVGVTVADPELARVETLRAGEMPNLLRGREAFAAGDYAAAAELFARAVEAAPKSARARLNLAAALGEAGRIDEALDQLATVLELDPEHAGAHFNRGILLVRAGRDGAAVEALLEAAHRDPTDPEAPLQAAAALARLGRADEALDLYDEATRRHPGRPEGWLGSADLLLRRGDDAAALARLEEAHRMLPHSPEVAVALSRLRSGE